MQRLSLCPAHLPLHLLVLCLLLESQSPPQHPYYLSVLLVLSDHRVRLVPLVPVVLSVHPVLLLPQV